MDPSNLTPAMRQFAQLKEQYPDCVIMFRMGDFYEMFYEDAELAAKELEITLTSRGKGERKAPLAGLPYHALDPYLKKFVKKGYKVAICEQLEDPKKAKGLVKRGVVRIVTPGTLYEQDEKHNNYIMSLFVHGDDTYVAVCELSTGEFFVSDNLDYVNVEECVIPSSLLVNKELIESLKKKGLFVSEVEDRYFSFEYAKQVLLDHFKVLSLEGFGLQGEDKRVRAAGALLAYLRDTQMQSLSHIKRLGIQEKNECMVLDNIAVRNLELFKNVRDNSNKGSLVSVLDKTETAMGSRLLRKWMAKPLLNVDKINFRLDKVEFFVKNLLKREELKQILKQVSDMERLIGKVNFGSVSPRDILALNHSLKFVKKIKLEEFGDLSRFEGFDELIHLLDKSIREDAAATIKDGNVIKLNCDERLTELHSIRKNSKQFLSSLEAKEREKTGIKNLRIGFNRVFGYYFEVSAGNFALVPDYFIRKQTLINYERFITEDLKREEEKILTAQEKIGELEQELFVKVVEDVKSYTSVVQNVAYRVSVLDVLLSFAIVSVENNYVRPLIDNSEVLEIEQGRHPVVELSCDYIPNGSMFKGFEIMIITGPNFSGKSCYMKQVAMIIIMGQMGCFVPVKCAHMGVVDRVFTRIGAYDDLIAGQSTFMVEMSEAANILNNATSKSLVLLDEIGRGTSTYDGVSIAWATVEYIYNRIKAKTMFATHYHVLNKLEASFENIKNYNIAVKEDGEEIVFLRTLLEGGTDKSFGVYVAKLAGLPDEVISRAKEVQQKLEDSDTSHR
ncbi:MAG: DNA mismatch repair protein MutS, partial [Nanoarchaeota archaeon]|nr:DNA mismatch repair protein MutS [Nanoarchaeota archaeon]